MLLKDINTNDKKFFEYSSVPLIGGDVCAYRIVLQTEFDLTGCRAVINAKRSDGRVFSDAGEVNKNIAVYIINSSMYSVAGEVSIRLSVISNDGSTVTDKELVFEAVEEFGIGDMCTEDGKSIADVFTAHMENAGNPHHVTADQIGLGDVQDNIKSLEKNKLSYTIADSLPNNAYLGINCAYFIKYNKSDYDAVDNPNAVGYRMYMGIKNNNTYVWSMIGEVDNGSVTTAKIADSAVTGNKISSYAVTNTKIASGAVTSDKIYDKSVTSAKLADAGVTSAKIASGAVTKEKIADGAVTGGKIADKTINRNNMAWNSISAENLTPALFKTVTDGAACHRPYYMSQRHYSFDAENEVNHVFYIFNDMDAASSHIYAGDDYGWDIYQETADGNLVPFSVAPGEIRGAYIYSEYIPGVDGKNGMLFVTNQARGIHGLMIEDESITSSKICSLSINQYLLADNAVISKKISDNAVTSGKIEDDAVTSAKIASGAVTEAKIKSGAVTTGKIATCAVTSSKIADGAVSSGEIANSAVTSTKIANGAVSSAKIADGAVTAAKLSLRSVNKNNLSPDIQKILEEGPEKYSPYFMSGYQRFENIEDFKNFYLCNDMDYATSHIYAADDYGWNLYYEDDDGYTLELVIQPGEIYEVYISTRFVSGVDGSDGIIFATKKVDNLNAVVLKNGSITTDKLDDCSVTSDKIKNKAIGMEHLSDELKQLLAKIK